VSPSRRLQVAVPSSARPDVLQPGLRVVIAGTRSIDRPIATPLWYAGAGNQFWYLLRASGLTPRRLDPEEADLLPGFGVGLIDLLFGPDPTDATRRAALIGGFQRAIRRNRPAAVAFVSKTAASAYARAVGQRAPRGYGPVPWLVAGRPGFVLPGPSGANNGMPLPLRTALWRDLADFLEALATCSSLCPHRAAPAGHTTGEHSQAAF
jgi:double-stranded uracil-DNA glycosylase